MDTAAAAAAADVAALWLARRVICTATQVRFRYSDSACNQVVGKPLQDIIIVRPGHR